jgi:hypothetical protein
MRGTPDIYNAVAGYDLASGGGTIDASKFVRAPGSGRAVPQIRLRPPGLAQAGRPLLTRAPGLP